ncbi:MAG TPA: hypothetical protein VEC57_00015 [Candidatus Limnocylindrales bacterium]|nr:hypothetical protein [Candidatus Limnocylindrales bacterium]
MFTAALIVLALVLIGIWVRLGAVHVAHEQGLLAIAAELRALRAKLEQAENASWAAGDDVRRAVEDASSKILKAVNAEHEMRFAPEPLGRPHQRPRAPQEATSP